MAYSYNGWLASRNPADFGGLEKLVVAGEDFAPGVRAGDVHTVLQYVASELHARVEPVVRDDWHQADDWGYNYRNNTNANNLSCHASGTAFDYNATRHPNRKRGTFTPAQVKEIRKILAEVDDVVRWGGDFSGTPDEMHFEICKDARAVSAVAARLRAPGPRALYLTHPRMHGLDVERLQLVMNRWYPHMNIIVDGWFGTQMDTAVRELQTRAGLTVDGVVGQATRKVLGI